MKTHSSEVTAFGSPISLPSMVTATGPKEIVDVNNTASWDGSSTLSFTAAVGANCYYTTLADDNGLTGQVWMTTPSITFPTEFISGVLNPGPNWDVKVSPMWYSGTLSLDSFTKTVPTGAPVGLSFEAVMVGPNPAGNGSKADVIP